MAVGNDILEGNHVLVATGAMPAALPFPGAEHLAQRAVLGLEALPSRLIFVGGGYISFEFAHVAVRAGADVTILHRGARPLPGFEPELVDKLVQRTRALGVHVELETEVQAIEKTSNGVRVYARTAGMARQFETAMAVHGAGRVPEIDDLDLDTAGIAYEKRGVTVNDYLQSVSNPAVYAAGDAAASGPP